MDSIHFAGTDFYIVETELSTALKQALLDCGRSGPADGAVEHVMAEFAITGDEDDCRNYLKGYGAWDDAELADHHKNLERLVWLTGCSLHEQGGVYFSAY